MRWRLTTTLTLTTAPDLPLTTDPCQEQTGRVALGCTGLGRAFALSEGRSFGFSSSAKFPMRLQGSRATIKAIGDADAKRLCPPSTSNPNTLTYNRNL